MKRAGLPQVLDGRAEREQPHRGEPQGPGVRQRPQLPSPAQRARGRRRPVRRSSLPTRLAFGAPRAEFIYWSSLGISCDMVCGTAHAKRGRREVRGSCPVPFPARALPPHHTSGILKTSEHSKVKRSSEATSRRTHAQRYCSLRQAPDEAEEYQGCARGVRAQRRGSPKRDCAGPRARTRSFLSLRRGAELMDACLDRGKSAARECIRGIFKLC